jgi:hypothetical protein
MPPGRPWRLLSCTPSVWPSSPAWPLPPLVYLLRCCAARGADCQVCSQ